MLNLLRKRLLTRPRPNDTLCPNMFTRSVDIRSRRSALLSPPEGRVPVRG
jgi:hypothetical protein